MTSTGGAKRPVKLNFHTTYACESIRVILKSLYELSGGLHWADSVRTGWTDAHLEQIEYAQRHIALYLF